LQEYTSTYLLQLNKRAMLRGKLHQAVTALSLMVVLGVFWWLKLTGITMSGEAFCGMDEHVHSENCTTKTLVCSLAEEPAHVHSESCILRKLVCNEEAAPAHTHDESCLLQELVCKQEAVPAHVHDEACLAQALACTLPQQEGHTHSDSCRGKTLACTIPEGEGHSHGTDCFAQQLTCTLPEEAAHQHGDGCYSEQLTCSGAESEEHVHDASCRTRILTCSATETPGHSHTLGCYESVLVCTQEVAEGHSHTDACYILSEEVCCGTEEAPAHTHSQNCYAPVEGSYTCGQEAVAPHTHTQECYAPTEGSYTCQQEETAGHSHTDACWHVGIGFGCGMIEANGHVHTESCLSEQTQLACGKSATPGHTHSDACYLVSQSCSNQEHIHTASCYSNINADLETADDWELTLADTDRGTTTAQTVVAIAQSQLGYMESTLNFQVDLHGVRRGITRYGQWYGNPYGDWSAMFVSFCLSYAGAEGLPANAGPEAMRLEWEEAQLYRAAAEYAPLPGNLMFLHKAAAPGEPGQNTAYANAAAIITSVTETAITAIEGDVNGSVAETTYDLDDPAILGYGVVPEFSTFALRAAPAAETEILAKTIDYNANMFSSSASFVVYTVSNGSYYAFDGSGNAVPITIDAQGNIRTDSADPDSLLWSFTASGNAYVIRNLSTGRYLHPFYNSQTDQGVTTSGNWTTSLVRSGSGVLLQASAYAQLNANRTAFVITRNQSSASVFLFGIVERCTIWLDGTQGDLMSLGGSDKQSISAKVGDVITLPSQWTSPTKYNYRLNGWYDVKNGTYYEPGAQLTVTEELLLYADWVAGTYDIGQMNADVVDTVSTAEFITTRLFDYNSLFNTLSLRNDYNGGETTRWTMVETGTVAATGEETLNFIFVDHDGSGSISYPVDRNQANGVDYTVVTPGLYNEHLAELLFDPELDVIGKTYLGLGDHLFQYGADPSDTEHYGYYYYDSRLNAASYNQSRGRFYVYDYLERTADSANNNSYADFLPLNSPYANTNGKNPGTYTYNGDHNEYHGTTHYSYDSKYSDNNNSTSRIGTNYGFGMVAEMEFYLPAVPGTRDSDGTLANQSITGEDMVFEFSGDDDVWVLIDGELVLDIGGIHGVEAGSIDFSTGEVIVDGRRTGDVTHLSAGSHTLTMYYLERGASMSNFKLRFNLSTRYTLTLRKEDTLTAHLLNGAEFTIYTDEACTQPAELWPSRDAHSRGEPSTNRFTVSDGVASMWGFAAGNTYYIVETRGPDNLNGRPPNGIIRMRLNNAGKPDYEVLPDANGNLTVGYTVHGFKVSEDTQDARLSISNTDATESEPTQVYVQKVWDDNADHSSDSITVYLLANGVRIQSVTLNESTNWEHLWENLPKTDADGNDVTYSVWEATVPGYVGTVEPIQGGSGGSSGGGTAASSFENGETYALQTDYGYIGAANNKLQLEGSQSTAMNSDAFLWVATVNNNGTVTLKNKTGHTLYYDNYAFKVSTRPGNNRNLNFSNNLLYYSVNYGFWRDTQYPVAGDNVVSNVTHNNCFYTTNNAGNAMTITPIKPGSTAPPPSLPETDAPAFRITNTPAGEATISLTVNKVWDLGNMGQTSMYEALTIPMKLLADGEDSGLTGMLSLRNGWSYTFTNLPKYNSRGSPIQYTVLEDYTSGEWHPKYGPVTAVNGSDTRYETTVTNVYHITCRLPETGSFGRQWYTLLGSLIMLSASCWYCGQRRKNERREC